MSGEDLVSGEEMEPDEELDDSDPEPDDSDPEELLMTAVQLQTINAYIVFLRSSNS